MRLEELRSTLAEHADAIDDQPQARIAPVHQRITVARRRRRAVVAGVVAAAVAAVALAVVPPFVVTRDVAPAGGDAPAQLAGRPVPRTQTATGFTYRYVRGYQSDAGARSLDVRVPDGDRPKLVMWASSDTDSGPVVRLAGASDRPEVGSAGGFGRYALLPTYDDGRPHTQRLHLTQRGAGKDTRLALAVYELAGLPKAGVDNGTIVFRKQVAGESLLRAVIGRAGQTDVSAHWRLPRYDLPWTLGWAYTCYGTRDWLQLSVDGKDAIGTQCHEEPTVDAGANPATFTGTPVLHQVRDGATVTVRLRLTADAQGRRPISDPDAVLGLGLYTSSAPSHAVAGTDVPDLTEYDGHAWVASRWQDSDRGARELRVSLPAADRPRLVRWAVNGMAHHYRTELRIASHHGGPGRAVDGSESMVGGWSSGAGYVVQPGESPDVVLGVAAGGTRNTVLGLVISDQVR